MANDIFISYSTADTDFVRVLATALAEQGWTVWWDRALLTGDSFADKIMEALQDSTCVVVVWSKAAVRSHWVRAEASEAWKWGKLFPVRKEEVDLPLPFTQVHTEDLIGWRPAAETDGFKSLCAALAGRLGTHSGSQQEHETEAANHATKVSSAVRIRATRTKTRLEASTCLVVDPSHPDAYPTISAAVAAAPDNAEIIVHPGVHEESELRIDRPLILRGLDVGPTCILKGGGKHLLVLSASVLIENLHLEFHGDSGGCAVLVSSGNPELRKCKVTAPALCGSCIFAVGGDVTILDSRIAVSQGYGLWVARRATALIERSEVSNHAQHGIAVFQFASSHIIDCSIHGNGDFGIVAQRRSACLIEGCDVHHNYRGAIEVRNGSVGEIRSCTVSHNHQGVRFSDQSSGVVCDCVLNDNELTGLYLLEGSTVRVTDNNLYGNMEMGISVFDKVDCVIERNEIRSNGMSGIYLGNSVGVHISGNRIFENREAGIIANSSEASVQGNEVTQNGLSGIMVRGTSNVSVSGNRAQANTEGGIKVSGSSRVQLISNDIESNGISGIISCDDSTIIARKNQVTNNEEHGIKISGGAATLDENSVRKNALSGIAVSGGAHVQCRRNDIRENLENGVYVFDRGRCDVVQNTLAENGYQGLAVKEGSHLSAKCNRVADSGQHGVWIYQGAFAAIVENEILRSRQSGITLTRDCAVQIERNQIRDNADAGILVEEGGTPGIEDNVFSSNTWGDVLRRKFP